MIRLLISAIAAAIVLVGIQCMFVDSFTVKIPKIPHSVFEAADLAFAENDVVPNTQQWIPSDSTPSILVALGCLVALWSATMKPARKH